MIQYYSPKKCSKSTFSLFSAEVLKTSAIKFFSAAIMMVGTSLSVNAQTTCAPSNIPYLIPFEDATTPAMPPCVTFEDINNDGKTWTTVSSVVGMTGKQMRYRFSIPNAGNDWFYTNGLNLTVGQSYSLTFKYKSGGFQEKLKVAIGTSASSTAMTTELTDITIPSTELAVITETLTFVVPTTGVYNIGFQAHSAAYMNELYVGSVSVEVDSSCESPTELSVASITSDSVTLSWMAAAGAANGYKYEIRTSGAAGSGAEGLAASGTTATAITTADITALTPNTEYSVYVASVCSSTESNNWTAAAEFFTNCNTPVITADHIQTITVDALEDATLADLAPSGTNITWFGNTADADANANELVITTQLVSGTTYYAVLTENGCKSLPFDVTVTVALGVANQTMTGLSYYPNPVQNQLTVNYSENITSIAVFNLVGQKVMNATPNASNVVLDMSTLAAGTYMIQVNADSASKVIKLIKK